MVRTKKADNLAVKNFDRRQFLLAAGSTVLTACSNIPTTQILADTFSAGRGPDQYPLTPEQIRASPYATLGVRVNRGARAVVVLARMDGPDLHWISADRALIVTRHGRIIKTAGFKLNLRETILPDAVQTALAQYAESGVVPASSALQLEFDGGQMTSQRAAVSYRPAGTKTLELKVLGEREAVGVHERLALPTLKWSVNNTYWYEKTSGRFLCSEQTLHPDFPVIECETLKPAAI